jgi:hypothetical protein
MTTGLFDVDIIFQMGGSKRFFPFTSFQYAIRVEVGENKKDGIRG